MGWESLENGELMQKAEDGEYQVIVATEKYTVSAKFGWKKGGNHRADGYGMAWARHKIEDIRTAIDEARPGQAWEVPIFREYGPNHALENLICSDGIGLWPSGEDFWARGFWV